MRVNIIKGGWAFLILLLLVSPTFASGNIKIEKTAGTPDCTIKNASDSIVDPKAAYDGGKLKFYTAVPGNPQDLGVPLVPNKVTDFANYVEFYFTQNDSSVTLRCWDGTHYGYGSSGYSDDKTKSEILKLGPASTPSNQWLKTFRTDYLADGPNAPDIGAIDESSKRDGSTTNQYLTLVVPVSYSEGAAPNIRQVSASSPAGKKYAITVTYPDNTTQDFPTDSSITLSTRDNPKVVPGHYSFMPKAYNWFKLDGTLAAKAKTWDTLSNLPGTPAAADSIDITLKKKTGDFGINTIAFPFLPAYDAAGTPINNVKALVAALNAAGSGYVATFGYWDETTQKETFYVFNERGEVTQKVNLTEEPEALSLNRGRGYQISVTGDKVLNLKNAR
jgi:hypothetical protein